MADHLNDREQENRSSSKSHASDLSIYLLTLSYEIAGMASGLNHLCRIKPMLCIDFGLKSCTTIFEFPFSDESHF